jgi:hypothetical protein
LEESAQPKIEEMDWPALELRDFMEVEEVKEASIGCYWRPKSKTNAAFDAVCTGSIGIDMNAALKFTVSKHYNIKLNGKIFTLGFS